MEQIRTNCRQIIVRGNEIRKQDLKKQGQVYAVSRRDPDTRELIWGIIIFPGGPVCGDVNSLVETFNVTASDKWAIGLITTDHLRFYEPTPMEYAMAVEHKQHERSEWNLNRANASLKMYSESRWHRVASALRKFFSC